MDFPQLSEETLEELCGVVARCKDVNGHPVRFYPGDVLTENILRQLPLRALIEGNPFLAGMIQ